MVQLVRNRMKGDQDQDSITVFVGTWNMGETREGRGRGEGGGRCGHVEHRIDIPVGTY